LFRQGGRLFLAKQSQVFKIILYIIYGGKKKTIIFFVVDEPLTTRRTELKDVPLRNGITEKRF